MRLAGKDDRAVRTFHYWREWLSVVGSSIEDVFDMVAVEAMGPGPELAAVLLSADPGELDAGQTRVWLRAWQRLEAFGEGRRFEVLGHYADLHPPLPESDPGVRAGLETAMRPGGEGTPEVAEFAIDELAVATGCTEGRVYFQLADALDLRHRMPVLFARLRAGAVPASKVRQVLRAARTVPLLAARRIDERIAGVVERVGPKRLAEEVEKALIEVDPAEAARRAAAASDRRGVGVSKDEGGNARIVAEVEAIDAMAFDAAIDKIADMLGDLGDARCKDVRRAAAVGWLANPPATLALVTRHQAWVSGAQPMPWPTASGVATETGDDGEQRLAPGLWRLDVPTPADLIDHRLWPAATVVVHLDHGTWLTEHGPVDLAGYGPITAEQAFERLRQHRVTIKPVIDLEDQIRWRAPASSDFTGALREAVLLANPTNPFPYADAASKDADDLDHTEPRRAGGPTTLANGAPLRRRLHRVKTFAKGWRVKQPFPGIVIWRSPDGRIYLCDRRGHTHDLDQPATG